MNLLEICERVLSLRLTYDKHQRRWGVTAILKDGTVWGGNGEDLEEVCKRIPATTHDHVAGVDAQHDERAFSRK